MQVLALHGNQIGDAGLSALAEAVGKGALASLKELIADEGPLGVDHPKLKAACQSRGITLRLMPAGGCASQKAPSTLTHTSRPPL